MNLENILKMSEKELKSSLYYYLKEKGMSPVAEDGFIYAKGEIPILLVAHMDTVFEEPPKHLEYHEPLDILYSYEGGIGADDRCGVYAITKILESYQPHILFTSGEEIGCQGAQEAVALLEKPNVKYIIELDRHGKNDCVFYNCGNEEFMEYIETFKYKLDFGTGSDISVLAPIWNVAAVNLSIGYYNEHTNLEYICVKELEKNILRVMTMLKNHKTAKYYDYQQQQYDTKLEGIKRLILSKKIERKPHDGQQ